LPRRAAPPAARGKIVSRRRARELVRRAQRRGERVVFTSGCFDLLHVGHVRSLESARRRGERLVVGVNSDTSVRRMKGPGRPIVPARQRAELLAALACVDLVVVFPEATPRGILAALRPDVYAKGGDWPLDVLRAKDLPPGFAGRVVRLRQVPGVRTSRIVERVRRNAGAAGGVSSG
jgi:D-beta-D-heptose 7-phosphate kinase/D-beta-D-heptose 1-phosphate adenosyltransferase